jgi:hypothetical protein
MDHPILEVSALRARDKVVTLAYMNIESVGGAVLHLDTVAGVIQRRLNPSDKWVTPST